MSLSSSLREKEREKWKETDLSRETSFHFKDHLEGGDGDGDGEGEMTPVENLGLEALAKFFALLPIFRCQLLFPNKQDLHRF